MSNHIAGTSPMEVTLESTPYWCSEEPASQLGNRCIVGDFNPNDQLDWMISNTDQSNSDLGFVDLWMDRNLVWQTETSDMYWEFAMWKQDDHLELYISSWWGSVVGYEWDRRSACGNLEEYQQRNCCRRTFIFFSSI